MSVLIQPQLFQQVYSPSNVAISGDITINRHHNSNIEYGNIFYKFIGVESLK